MFLFFLLFFVLTSLASSSVEYSGSGSIVEHSKDGNRGTSSPEIEQYMDDEDYFGEGSGTESEVFLLILDRDDEIKLSTKKCPEDVRSSSSSSRSIPRNFIALCFLLYCL